MIERRERGVETAVMIENRPGAIYIERRPEFLLDARKIDIFAVKFAVVVMKRMHCAFLIANAASRQCHQRNENEQCAEGADNGCPGWKVPVKGEEQPADAADERNEPADE